jgi:hypothetical protein
MIMSVAKRMAQKRRELYKKYQVDSDNSLIYEMTDRIAELECKLNRILSLQEQEGFKEDDQTLAEIFLICRESEQ